jgi:thioredoxin reductase (NADPH)
MVLFRSSFKGMTPAIVVTAPDAALRSALADVLSRRYGGDYRVIITGSPAGALEDLAGLREMGALVAVVLAPLRMAEPGGVAFFDAARRLHPMARRIAILEVGDVASAGELSQALTLSQIDMYFGQPWASPEEEVHPVVGEALRVWAREHQPRYAKAVIVDTKGAARGPQLGTWLERNSVVTTLHAADSPDGRQVLDRHRVAAGRLPVVALYDGRVLVDPADDELAEALGARTHPSRSHYDVAIVGGGPAGLAAAVYASSDGLHTAVIEQEAWGGQAGTSSKIRNYLGFPWGVGGADLAERATRQAEQLGAEYIVARSATGVRADGSDRIVVLSNGETVRARAVIIAAGVTYRRLGVPAVDALVGAGVFYGAAVSDARSMGGLDVFVLGGGNSAGQAAVHLASAGARVTIVIRAATLAATMSDYLRREIAAAPSINVLCASEVLDAGGTERLDHLVICDRSDGSRQHVNADAMFIFIGAVPRTEWLDGTLAIDDHRFLLTGPDLILHQPSAWRLDRPPSWLETSSPDVFAAGDIRHGSTKRVAAAVGEGSTAAMLAGSHLIS